MSNSKFLYLTAAAIVLYLGFAAPVEAQQRVNRTQYEPNTRYEPHAIPQTVSTKSGEVACNTCNTRHTHQRSHCERKANCQQDCKCHDGACDNGKACELSTPPFGASINAILSLQKARGRAAMQVLYHYDFHRNGDLNIYGKRRLARIARHLPSNPFPIIIQRDHSKIPMNEARRRAVIQELSMQKFPVPPERVVIGWPPARAGLGLDAVVISEKMLSLTAGGLTGGGGGTAGGGGGVNLGGGAGR